MTLLRALHLAPSGVPIYVQLRDQVLCAIAAGTLAPGDRMPTMREVAVALRIDLNTVRHAYDALARAGAIVVRPARGSFVADQPAAASPAGADGQSARLDDLAARTILAARALGLDPNELARRILAINKRKVAGQ
jgi:GntR family transcriptional regulator